MRRLLVACAVLTAVASPAFAHHSAAAYDMTRVVSIEGTVAALSWKNPHVSMTLETQGPDGAPLLQEIEVMSVAQARGLGLRREAISPGQHLVVRAAPSRRGPKERVFGVVVTTNGGVAMPLSSFARFSAATPSAVEARGIAGRWVPTVESFVTTVAATAAAPVTEAGRAARQAALSRYYAPGGAGVGICTPLIPPLLHVFPDLRTIEVTAATVVILSETNGMMQRRIVHLDQQTHPAGLEPTAEGHSVGRWEGESLVIDTVGFTPSETPDLTLLPTRPDTHLVERLTLTQDRRHLEYEFTIDAPEYLAEPATFRAMWDHRPDLEPSNEACDPETARR
jgi:hypothetical protein